MPLKKHQWDVIIIAQALAIALVQGLALVLAQEDVKLVAVVVRGHVEALAKGHVQVIVTTLALELAWGLVGKPVLVRHRVINYESDIWGGCHILPKL